MTSFIDAGVEREEAAKVVGCMQDAVDRAMAAGPLDAIAAADAEDELLDVLEAFDVPDAYRLTEPLAAAGVDRAWLERTAVYAGRALPAALAWIAASITAVQLTSELTESTERMSSLVSAIKSYAYMDRGGLVEIDVREGIETTLKVLKHKVKHTQIEVVREYADDLPKLTVHGSALNQVWTNLLDNAIQALGEAGTITITARLDGDCVLVDVADSGSGIPADILDRVFDPFFTTKEVGHGTGLGLQTARRIVVDQHGGNLTVDSEPGRTVFHVWLPIRQ
jgi:signal transduction histidine kinase